MTSASVKSTAPGSSGPAIAGPDEEVLPGRASAVLIGIVGLVGVVAFGSIIGIPHVERHLREDIERHALEDATGVEVAVDGRTAVLSGFVRSADERRAVIDRVARRWGVARIDAERLEVQIPRAKEPTRAAAASAAGPAAPASGEALGSAKPPTPATADPPRSISAPTSTVPPPTTVADTGAVKRLETELASIGRDAPIVFARSSPTLLATARVPLDRIAAALVETPVPILIEAHTDSSGNPVGNAILSTQRASAVRDALIARGVSPAIVTAVGRGASSPIASNTSPAGRAQNRRVELIVVSSVGGSNP